MKRPRKKAGKVKCWQSDVSKILFRELGELCRVQRQLELLKPRIDRATDNIRKLATIFEVK